MPRTTKKTKKKPSRRDYYTPQFHTLRIDPFNVDLFLGVNLSEGQMLQGVVDEINRRPQQIRNKDRERVFLEGLIQQMSGWDDDLFVGGIACRPRGGYAILLRAKPNNFRQFLSNLIHEVTHAVAFILRERKTPLSEDTDEIYAYMMGDVVWDACNALWD
jgi:hypothetical protein